MVVEETEVTMTIEEIRKRLAKARKVVSELCNGEREWIMSIPAEYDRDPDLIISASLKDIDKLLARIEELEREVKVKDKMIELIFPLGSKVLENLRETAEAELVALGELERSKLDIIKSFVEDVNRIAEDNMLKTGKLEGAHYNAMKELVKNYRAEPEAQP